MHYDVPPPAPFSRNASRWCVLRKVQNPRSMTAPKARGKNVGARPQEVAYSPLSCHNVTFIVPPRISPFFFGDGVMEGQRTQLMCTTSQGDQPFNITWLMDEKPIQVRPSDGGTSVSSVQTAAAAATVETSNGIQISDYPPFSSILTINSVSASHSGNYTCQISNIAGLAEHSTSLSVAGWCPEKN